MIPAEQRSRLGFGLVIFGLVVQLAASFFWSPATFIVSAALGLPLVLAGALLIVVGARRAGEHTSHASEGKADGNGPA